ncbi:MAG: tRNA (pseudouridine(54)-N(1))-methyltransferase TrmY [Thermoplasmatota archaeon]
MTFSPSGGDWKGRLADLFGSRRNFIVIAHRARSDGKIFLNDLCGASGRWDGIARCITGALFLSHDMRRDTSFHALLLGPEDPPKLLTVSGSAVKYLNPDERASSALMKKCLGEPLEKEMGAWIEPSPGITITRIDLEGIMDVLGSSIVVLDEKGRDMEALLEDLPGSWSGPGPIFLLSDDQDPTEDERALIDGTAAGMFSVGPRVLHSYQTIIIIHSLLDRGGEQW